MSLDLGGIEPRRPVGPKAAQLARLDGTDQDLDDETPTRARKAISLFNGAR